MRENAERIAAPARSAIGSRASFNRVHCFPRNSVKPVAFDKDDSRLNSPLITPPPPSSNRPPSASVSCVENPPVASSNH